MLVIFKSDYFFMAVGSPEASWGGRDERFVNTVKLPAIERGNGNAVETENGKQEKTEESSLEKRVESASRVVEMFRDDLKALEQNKASGQEGGPAFEIRLARTKFDLASAEKKVLAEEAKALAPEAYARAVEAKKNLDKRLDLQLAISSHRSGQPTGASKEAIAEFKKRLSDGETAESILKNTELQTLAHEKNMAYDALGKIIGLDKSRALDSASIKEGVALTAFLRQEQIYEKAFSDKAKSLAVTNAPEIRSENKTTMDRVASKWGKFKKWLGYK